MSLLVPILMTLCIAAAIVVWARWARKNEISEVHRLVNDLNKLSGEIAIRKVSRMIESDLVRATVASKTDECSAEKSFGEMTAKFTSAYDEVIGEGFRFVRPSKLQTIAGMEYFLVGESSEGQSKYLLKQGTDRVYVWDVEDTNVDSTITFPSMWQAILFESSNGEGLRGTERTTVSS